MENGSPCLLFLTWQRAHEEETREGAEWSFKNCFTALMFLKPELLLDLKGIIRQGILHPLPLFKGECITDFLTAAVGENALFIGDVTLFSFVKTATERAGEIMFRKDICQHLPSPCASLLAHIHTFTYSLSHVHIHTHTHTPGGLINYL